MREFLTTLSLIVFSFTVSGLAQSNRGAGNRPPATENAEKRFALVIGNGAYANSPLKNPVNDATDIAAALGELGFEVTLQTNLKKDDMKRAIRTFGEKLKSSRAVGLFYYAGHGVQVKGINYLIPVDATANSEQEIEYEAVEAGSVLAQMEAANNKMNFVILDACRNNPFARSYRSDDKGLAQMDAPRGSLIAYSTAPGSIALDGSGRNGIYTAELLKQLRIPDLDIKDVFQRVRVSVLNLTQNKQTPWESYSLTDNFYFRGKGKTAVVITDPPPVSNSVELTFWSSIKDSKDVEDYKEYLERFPNGEFANLARRRIRSLQTGQTNNPPPVTEKPKSAAPSTWTIDASLFTFELLRCRLSGTTVFCDFNITNNDKDRRLEIYGGSYLFDDFNNQVRANRTELANETGYSATAFLVSGVKTRARIIFDNVSAEATKATLLSLTLDSDNTDNFKIQYRNIPLKELSRSLNTDETEDTDQAGSSPQRTAAETNRDNNQTSFQVSPGQGWTDSGINVSPGMKIEVAVTGALTFKVDNKPLSDITSRILKRQINLPPSTKTIGGKAVITKIRYRQGGDSNILTVGDKNTLIIENGEYGRLYFAVSDKYASGSGSLTVNLRW